MDLSQFKEFTLKCMKDYKGSFNYFYKVFFNMPDTLKIHNLKKEHEVIFIDYCVEGWKIFDLYNKDKSVLHEKLKTLRDTYDDRLKKTSYCPISIRSVIDGFCLGDLFEEF